MIAFKTLKATTTKSTFDERDIGGAGGQPDWGGYRLDATDVAIIVRLPKISLSEGRVITFISVNPSTRSITIATPAGSTDRIVVFSTESTNISCTTDLGNVTIVCDGFRWFVAFTDGFA